MAVKKWVEGTSSQIAVFSIEREVDASLSPHPEVCNLLQCKQPRWYTVVRISEHSWVLPTHPIPSFILDIVYPSVCGFGQRYSDTCLSCLLWGQEYIENLCLHLRFAVCLKTLFKSLY